MLVRYYLFNSQLEILCGFRAVLACHKNKQLRLYGQVATKRAFKRLLGGKQGEIKQLWMPFLAGSCAYCLLKISENYLSLLSRATQCYQLPSVENQVVLDYLFSPQLHHKCRSVVPYFLPFFTCTAIYFAQLPLAEHLVALTYLSSPQWPHMCFHNSVNDIK